MSLFAAGAYLKELREALPMSRVDVAAQAKTNESQVFRVESGDVDTRGSLLLLIARIVRADLNVLADLLLSDTATAQDGAELARIQTEALLAGGATSITEPSSATLSLVLQRLNALEADLQTRIAALELQEPGAPRESSDVS